MMNRGVPMQKLRLTDQADVGVMFDAFCSRVGKEEWNEATVGGTVTRELFIAYCIAQKFPTLGFECDGRPIGGILFDGNEAHIEVLPDYHCRWGVLWRSAIRWVFSLQDPIMVRVHQDNEKCHQFMARNNWPRIKEDERFVTYEMSSRAQPRYFTPHRALPNQTGGAAAA
jgi:hypothetical protein